MSTNTDLLNLSTSVKETKKFAVDGVPYEMFTTDHLSPSKESQVQAWFARHQILTERLAMTDNVQLGVKLADAQREAQLQVIGLMTTLPRDVAEKLPPTAKARLIEALTIELVDDGEDAPKETPTTPDVGLDA